MNVKIEDQVKKIDFEGKISRLLDSLSLNPETVVVLKNGKVVSEDERASSKDELEIISVVSSG